MDKLVVKFAATTLDETVGYDIYKIFQDLFLPAEKRDNMRLREYRAKICAKSAQMRGQENNRCRRRKKT